MSIGVSPTTVGAAVRHRRLGIGMTVAHLAQTLGVRPSQIGAWERGDALPPYDQIRAMARALWVDQATMLAWTTAAGSPDAVDVVIDLAHPDPFVTITDLPAGATRPAKPIRPRPVASVFPAPTMSLEADRHVYSTAAGFPAEKHPRLRSLRTAIVLVLLGVGLVVAFGQLGHGFGDLIGLFGG